LLPTYSKSDCILQGIILVTPLRCAGIFNDHLIANFREKYTGERVLT